MTPTDLRAIGVRLHDTTIGIWQDNAQDPTFRAEIFGPLIRMLRGHGWTVGADPNIVKNYNCLRHDHRLMRKGALRGRLQITSRCIEIEIWAEAEVRAEAWAAAVEAAARWHDARIEKLKVQIEENCAYLVREWNPLNSPANDYCRDGIFGSKLAARAIRALTPPAELAPLLAARDAREAKLREIVEWLKPLRNDVPATDEEFADAILALIGGDA